MKMRLNDIRSPAPFRFRAGPGEEGSTEAEPVLVVLSSMECPESKGWVVPRVTGPSHPATGPWGYFGNVTANGHLPGDGLFSLAPEVGFRYKWESKISEPPERGKVRR